MNNSVSTGKKKVILTFDDTGITQYNTAVPVLKEYGFNATFFVCEFYPDPKKGRHPDYMCGQELREMAEAGFEIGNHTLHHCRFDSLSDERLLEEIIGMETLFEQAGLPKPCSLAYPGGYACDRCIPILKEHGYRCARTNIHEFYQIRKHNVYEIPAFPVADKYPGIFEQVIDHLPEPEDGMAVLIYHGLPDPYPPCSTPPENFLQQMKILKERGFQGISLKDFMDSIEPGKNLG